MTDNLESDTPSPSLRFTGLNFEAFPKGLGGRLLPWLLPQLQSVVDGVGSLAMSPAERVSKFRHAIIGFPHGLPKRRRFQEYACSRQDIGLHVSDSIEGLHVCWRENRCK